MVEYKGGNCQVCGYSAVLRALTFHHVDPQTKDFDFGGGCHHRSWETIKNELDKTVLLCIRCHVEVEDGARVLAAEVVREVLKAIRDLPRRTRRPPGRPTQAVRADA
jgi:hypothetical protein